MDHKQSELKEIALETEILLQRATQYMRGNKSKAMQCYVLSLEESLQAIQKGVKRVVRKGELK